MKKHIYTTGALVAILSIGGLSAAVAYAQSTVDGVAIPTVSAMPVSVGEVSVSPSGIKAGDIKIDTGEEGRTNVRVGDDVQVDTSSTGSAVRVGDVRVRSEEDGVKVQAGDVQIRTDEQEDANVQVADDVEIDTNEEDDSVTVGGVTFKLERNALPVFSPGALKQSIEQRRQELEQEVASTTLEDQDVLEGANQVRLAVHALLVSKDLLGGIGQQVSEIAQQMNDSVASTTNAEVQIQSRGFFKRLLFGGDSSAADTISQEVAQNQGNVQTLTDLLSQANVSTDMQATLVEQITALQAEQARLQDLARKEKSRWGIFSWRF